MDYKDLSIKDKVDILSKKVDVLYKKALLLLALAGGSGGYSLKLFHEKFLFLGIILAIILVISILGLGIIYIKLNNIEQEMENE